MARLPGTSPPCAPMRLNSRLCLSADYGALRQIGEWLDLVFEATPAHPMVGRLELALHEVCVNVVDHAYAQAPGLIDLELRCTGQAVTVTVADRGDAFPEAEVRRPDPDVPQVRGYGLLIVEQLADRLDYRRVGSGNVWTLGFDIPTAAGTGPTDTTDD